MTDLQAWIVLAWGTLLIGVCVAVIVVQAIVLLRRFRKR